LLTLISSPPRQLIRRPQQICISSQESHLIMISRMSTGIKILGKLICQERSNSAAVPTTPMTFYARLLWRARILGENVWSSVVPKCYTTGLLPKHFRLLKKSSRLQDAENAVFYPLGVEAKGRYWTEFTNSFESSPAITLIAPHKLIVILPLPSGILVHNS